MWKVKTTTLRLTIVFIYLAVLAYSFWTSSRYPALNEKAMMEGTTPTFGIGFDEKVTIDESTSWYEEILYGTINWAYTNKQGMKFGILFATGLLMLFSMLKNRASNSPFLRSGFGMLLGAPLGVCVNCAAPIAQGMRRGGASVETSLATMISSPTLNFLVLGMLFTLFPWYMVAIKLALTLLFILFAIPLLGKYFSPVMVNPNGTKLDEANIKKQHKIDEVLGYEVGPESESIFGSIKWFVLKWIKSFWYIIKMTLPFMILAGFLGNVAITLLPWDQLVSYLPNPETTGIIKVIIAIIVLGVVGIFLPVPMAFDIIICAVLISAGVPEFYVMALLFTLGIFSIYSFFIVSQSISRKIALLMVFSLVTFGSLAALATQRFTIWQIEHEREELRDLLSSNLEGPEIKEVDRTEETQSYNDLQSRLEEQAVSKNAIDNSQYPDDISVHAKPFVLNNDNGKDAFVRINGDDVGLGLKKKYRARHIIVGNVSSTHSISSGDIHQDGWQDLLVISMGELSIFANMQGKFIRQNSPVPDSLYVISVGLADIDNDSWLDLVVSSEENGTYYFLNNSGDFGQSVPQKLPNVPNARFTRPLAFADFDRDGDLDILLGNYTYGNLNRLVSSATGFPVQSRNALLVNEGGQFTLKTLPTNVVGESLTTLWSDLNQDGWVDLIEANDFVPPDVFYFNERGTYNKSIVDSDSLIDESTKTTMSLISGDINNDLIPEIFIDQISMMGIKPEQLRKTNKSLTEVCSMELSDPKDVEICSWYFSLTEVDRVTNWQKKDITGLSKSDQEFILLLKGIKQGELELNQIPEKWEYFKKLYTEIYKSDYNSIPKEELKQSIKSIKNGDNILLELNESGKYINATDKWGVNASGWSWNAKFADLNGDEFLDLFIVNGSHLRLTRTTHFLYMNQNGQKFSNEIEKYDELNSFLSTQVYTYVDFDNDGDQDIISVPFVGPIQVNENQMSKGNIIAVELRDQRGNTHGVGSKIFIEYGKENEKSQVRELLSSGGHLSHDPLIAYFGLGQHQEVNKIRVQWSTGEETILEGPFDSGSLFTISRSNQ